MVKKTISESRKKALQFIGATVRDLRKDRGLSLQDLADAVQIEGSTLGKFERGDVFLSLPNLASVADFFGMELADLFKRDIVPAPRAVAGELGRQPRFRVIGQINRKMPPLSSEQQPVISVPLEGDFEGATALKTEMGYLFGREIGLDENNALRIPAPGQRIVFLRLNVNNEPSLHVGSFLRSTGLGDEWERALLDNDAWLGKLVHIHDTAQLLAALQEEKPAKEDLPTTKNIGWLLPDSSTDFMPYASQTIAERWLIVAELRREPPPMSEDALNRPNALLVGLKGGKK